MNHPIESKTSKEMKELAPIFVAYGEKILFEEVWQDSTLTSKERSLVTLAALISMGNTEQLPFHLQLAEKHGINEKEIIALVTHIAFYSGWPKAAGALNILLNKKKKPLES
ncbi:carboxymuconolactone decarboxylase family protein [Priestia endophytica]|uniref:carboxymuconolactone decarboxylase family protein n=1 Tax=Priestia filamentosa TaxID=1402861 RepID=UPI002E1A2629|nr:carboxymuconolactone decarboxylase family protein [Priestia filamentosa]